jgi:hypothetical protein
LLETIDYAHGAGFVNTQLRLQTDYPILPRPCVPQLAAVLAAAQHIAVVAAVGSGAAFGLSAPEADVTDLFLPAQGDVHGEVRWYRGMNRNEYLYRCGSEQMSAEETWVVTGSRDEDAWSRCEGRVWIDLESARARTDLTDRSSAVGGAFFDLSLGVCTEEFAQIRRDGESADSVPDGAGPGQLPQPMAFPSGVSFTRVACTLAWRLSPFSATGTAGKSLTVLLPAGRIRLLSHVVVRAGESLTMQADETSNTSLALGPWQIQVEAGGVLELLGLGVSDAVGSSAMVIFGEVTATNCTFSRCVAGPNVIVRYAEGTSLEGSEENPPRRGVLLSSYGGAVGLFLNAAKLTANGCTFSENGARGARLLNVGGAITTLGGTLALSSGTIMRGNSADGGAMISRGGAINCIYARLDLSDVVFVGNEANGGSGVAGVPGCTATTGQTARGGVMDLASCLVTIASSIFTQNKARDASIRVSGGAIALSEGSVVEVRSCVFDRNEALRGAQLTHGGAIRVDGGASLRVADTSFAGNAAECFTEGFGGAIMSEGSVVLEGGVVFRANVVSGDVKAAGGAIAILSATASLNASTFPGALFVGNTVRRAAVRASVV